MAISFTCPHCGKQTNVAEQYAGQTGPCGGCGQMITIPVVAVTAQTMAASAAPSSGKGTSTGVIVFICVLVFLGCGGLLAALLLPAIGSAPVAGRRSQCSNNLKQITLAMQTYHDVYKSFPPAYLPDKDGKPMHSWRVLILPFLEQRELYERYDFNKPWNDPANQLVTSMVIPTYRCPSQPIASGANPQETSYMVITGPGTVFDGAKAMKMQEITDGTANTLLVVEVVGTGVSWAEPRDLDVSQFAFPPVPGNAVTLNSDHPGGSQVAFCDGSVRFISKTTSPTVIKSLITRADGEPIPEF